MDYNALLAQSRKELEELKSNKAVLQSRIDIAVEKFGLDKTKDLSEQIEALIEKLKAEKEKREKELDVLLTSLEKLTISTDE